MTRHPPAASNATSTANSNAVNTGNDGPSKSSPTSSSGLGSAALLPGSTGLGSSSLGPRSTGHGSTAVWLRSTDQLKSAGLFPDSAPCLCYPCRFPCPCVPVGNASRCRVCSCPAKNLRPIGYERGLAERERQRGQQLH